MGKIQGYDIDERAKSEKNSFNTGINREKYDSFFYHANKGPARVRRQKTLYEYMKPAYQKNVLELGSRYWSDAIDFDIYPPYKLTCINISENELKRGIQKAENLGVEDLICFKIMDAHNMNFKDGNFEMVYGAGILHHLNLKIAIQEIYRVLQPGGQVIFIEPLGINPVANIIRKLTPQARTPDERPFILEDFRLIEKYFNIKLHFFEFLSVPASVASRMFFKNPVNIINTAADKIDVFIEKNIKPVRWLYRQVMIYGVKKTII